MNISDNNIGNGYELAQVQSKFPQIIEYSTAYKELARLKESELQEKLKDIITMTLKRVRRYQITEIVDLAKLVHFLYGVKEKDSIQIKYNGKGVFDFSSPKTIHLLLTALNRELATSYSPERMIEFYNRLYPELLWGEPVQTPIDNKDTRALLFEYSASKNYKRIIEFEKDDDIDIRLYFGYKFKDNVTPYYAKNSKGELVQPIGFTLKGVKTILAIESTLQKRINSHYVGTLLYILGAEFQRANIYEITSQWFTNEQSAFLYDIVGALELIDEEFNPTYNTKEKQIFVRKEMIKYNKFIRGTTKK